MAKNIIKCNYFDLRNLDLSIDQIYYCVDMNALFKDYSNSSKNGRLRFNAVILNTEVERTDYTRPEQGKYYYVTGTNNLWLYDTKWICVNRSTNESYNTYTNSQGRYASVKNIDPVITDGNGDKIIDNNGLLSDGSVVVRDNNRYVKLVQRMNYNTNQIEFLSQTDNGFLFVPNALLPYNNLDTSLGALHLTQDRFIKTNDEGASNIALRGAAYYYGDWNNIGSIYTVENLGNVTDYKADNIPSVNEIYKLYITSYKIVDGKSLNTKIVIRPISDKAAYIEIYPLYDPNETTMVTDDLGNYIFKNPGPIQPSGIIECKREIYVENGYTCSRYTFNYGEYMDLKIVVRSTELSLPITIDVPDIFSDADKSVYYNVSKWTKAKVLSENSTEIETLKDKISVLENTVKELNNKISQLK